MWREERKKKQKRGQIELLWHESFRKVERKPKYYHDQAGKSPFETWVSRSITPVMESPTIPISSQKDWAVECVQVELFSVVSYY